MTAASNATVSDVECPDVFFLLVEMEWLILPTVNNVMTELSTTLQPIDVFQTANGVVELV